MSNFIVNVNKYLSELGIKKTYLSTITCIYKNKMSNLLTGSQEVSRADMEKIVRNETAPTPNLVLRLENGKTYTIYYGRLLSLNQDYNFFSDIADNKNNKMQLD